MLAGCDRKTDAPAQGEGTETSAEATGEAGGELTGTLDRSHKGELMPAVELVDPAGEKLNLGAVQGQPVLLNLWATWCAPCVTEMPMLDKLAGDYEGRLRVVVASQDMKGAEVVTPFFDRSKFAHLHPWIDPEGALGMKLGDGVLPTTVLYDAQGREVWRMIGGYDWASAEAKKLVDEAVAAP